MLDTPAPGSRADPCRGRLAIIVRAMLPLGALLLALDLGLGALVGPVQARQGYSALSSTDGIREISGRVAAVQAQLAAERPAGPPLAVLLGLSTAREGVDPARFQHASASHYRLLNLAASGGSFSEIGDYCRPLVESGLRPAIVIVGVHPSWLAGRVPPVSQAWPSLPANADPGALLEHGRKVGAWLVERSWILGNRSAINDRLRQHMFMLRGQVGDRFHVALDRHGSSAADPWTVASSYTDARAAPAFLATQLQQWQALGWFDPARLHEQADDAPMLREVLRSLRAISPRVVVVLMPEAEQFRLRVPPGGAQAVAAIAASVDSGMTVLDLRASMPASAFRDQAHLNADGRRLFSELLARELFPGPDANSAVMK